MSLRQANCFVKKSSSAAMAVPAIFLCFVSEGKHRRATSLWLIVRHPNHLYAVIGS
jgi:hypothetical protein